MLESTPPPLSLSSSEPPGLGSGPGYLSVSRKERRTQVLDDPLSLDTRAEPSTAIMARKKRSRNIAAEFNTYFGAGTVQDWQRLCRDVGLTGEYTNIKQCREVCEIAPLRLRNNPN